MRPILLKQLCGIILCCLGFTLALAAPAAKTSDVRYSDVRSIVIAEQIKGSDKKDLELEIRAYGLTFRLILQKNEKLLRKFKNPGKVRNIELYSGQLEQVPGSWVRVSKVRGKYTGAFFDGTELYLIDDVESVQDKLVYTEMRGTLSGRTVKTDRVIYKSSEIESNGTCGMSHASGMATFPSSYQGLVDELQTLAPSAASASAALELNVVIVADTEYSSSIAGDVSEEVMSQMNIVDGIFSEQIGVHLNITNILQLSNNGSLISTDPLNLLNSFQAYVSSQVGNPGLVHLFTGKNLNGNTVGIAYLDRLCHSYGVGLTQAGGNGAFGALIAAHEFGHNFGAPHDNESASACASTPGIYLMNPVINGSTMFSQCSRNQIAPSVTSAQCIGGYNPIPLFTSVASTYARVGLPYLYDEDSRASASGSGSITFSLANGPAGMTIGNTGLVNWTPQPGQEGSQIVQIIATNIGGVDTQDFTINVAAAPTEPVINFNQQPVTPYVSSEDISGSILIENNGLTLRLIGNRWKKIDLPYVVTPDTVLEFDFSSSQEGEIHGIGMASYLQLDVSKIFRMYGTQNTGISAFDNYSGGGLQHYVIPIGQYYTGVMQFLFFVMDHDVGANGESVYSNVRVYEDAPLPPAPTPPQITSIPGTTATVDRVYSYDADNRVEATGTAPITYSLTTAPTGMTITNGVVSWTPQAGQEGLNAVAIRAVNSAGADTQNFMISVAAAPVNPGISFNDNPPSAYVSSEDRSGTVSVEDGGASLRLVGNRWQKINFPYTVTSKTVIEFDFRSSVQGEIHGIGLDNDLYLSSNFTFQLYGTQNWGRLDYANYAGGGVTQHYVIPVGQYYTGAMQYLFFAMDHDIGSNGESVFSNVRVYEDEPLPPAPTPPQITSTPNTSATVGAPYNYDADNRVEATGTGPISYSLITAPAGMTTTDGVISWTPQASQEGINTVVVQASNSAGTDAQSFTVTVASVVTPPLITSTPNTSATVGAAYSYDSDNKVEATGTGPISYALNTAPVGMTITNGVISWTPQPNQEGINTVVVQASNSAGTDTQSFTVTVAAVVTPPQITSTPNTSATVGTAYSYDVDNRVEASGTGPISYSLTTAPVGMTITNGVISWIPQPNQEGANSVVVQASNSLGTDTQNFTINVSAGPVNPGINFIDNPPSTYDPTEDRTGTVTVEDGGATLRLVGNRWQKINLPYSVTSKTVIEFDFRSSVQGEIHGIGLDSDVYLSPSRTFRVYGTQVWGLSNYANYAGGGVTQHYVIPVGQYYTGTMQYLFFAMDHDIGSTGESVFSNVRVYEDVPSPQPPKITSIPGTIGTIGRVYTYDADNKVEATGTGPISYALTTAPVGMTITNGVISWTPQVGQEGANTVAIQASNSLGTDTQNFTINVSAAPVNPGINFIDNPPSTYDPTEDRTGPVTVEDGGATLRLIGNRWQKINFPYTLTSKTVIEFDFRSSVQGEIHGIGLDSDVYLSPNRTFRVYGTQVWGLSNYANYAGGGVTQHYVIPVGQYYTGTMQYLFFAMDHDIGSTGESVFSNVRVYEQ